MEELAQKSKITRRLLPVTNLPLALAALALVSLISGVTTGFVLAKKNTSSSALTLNGETTQLGQKTMVAQHDSKTFRDFAEGIIRPKKQPQDPTEYSEGTHYLERSAAAPIALTSSVVDLSKYEGKKVKVFGETQKALKEGWLMDIGKIEELK